MFLQALFGYARETPPLGRRRSRSRYLTIRKLMTIGVNDQNSIGSVRRFSDRHFMKSLTGILFILFLAGLFQVRNRILLRRRNRSQAFLLPSRTGVSTTMAAKARDSVRNSRWPDCRSRFATGKGQQIHAFDHPKGDHVSDSLLARFRNRHIHSFGVGHVDRRSRHFRESSAHGPAANSILI